MNEPLRPSNLGEILDRTAQLYRERFLVFFGIAAVPTAIVLVCASGVFLFFAWSGDITNPAVGIVAGLVILAVALVAVPIFLAVTALASAALNHAAARACFGQKTTIRDAYKAVWPQGWRYIWLHVLEALIIWVAPFSACFVLVFFSAGLVALAQSAGMGDSAAALFGLLAVLVVLALCAYCLWMGLRFSLAFPACIVEQIGAWPALKRSATLSKGTRGRVFLLYLLGWIINYILSMVLTMPLFIGMAMLPGAKDPQHQQTAAMTMLFIAYAAAFAVQALTKPVYGIALVVFYYDQRIRLEGFDIEWMMLRAGLEVPAPPPPEAAPWLSAIQPGAQPAPLPTTQPAADLPQTEEPPAAPTPASPSQEPV
jgi:hypothetical protein